MKKEKNLKEWEKQPKDKKTEESGEKNDIKNCEENLEVKIEQQV